jgi:S-DNA-T family DNA segregation ATPase FtsK/SpoIIIE
VRLTLSVLDRRRTEQPVRHVTIDAAAGTAFGDVRAGVVAAAGVAVDDDLRIDGRIVHDRDVLGEPPLLRGALLVAGSRADYGTDSRTDSRTDSGA